MGKKYVGMELWVTAILLYETVKIVHDQLLVWEIGDGTSEGSEGH